MGWIWLGSNPASRALWLGHPAGTGFILLRGMDLVKHFCIR